MAEERRFGERPRGMTERGVEAPSSAVLVTPRDRVVGAHRPAVVGRLVDAEQHADPRPRVAAERVPLVVPGPGRGQVAGCRMAAVLDGDRRRLLRGVLVEPCPGEPAEVGPVVFGGRRAVYAEPRAASRHVPLKRVPALVLQDVAAGGQEDDDRVPGQAAGAERRRVLGRVDGAASLFAEQAQRVNPGRDGRVPVARGARVNKQPRHQDIPARVTVSGSTASIIRSLLTSPPVIDAIRYSPVG